MLVGYVLVDVLVVVCVWCVGGVVVGGIFVLVGVVVIVDLIVCGCSGVICMLIGVWVLW